MKHLISAGVIVYRTIHQKIEYLLLQYNAKHWDFAKGKMEDGETYQETALRELYEEAGINAQLDEHFAPVHFSYIFHDYDGALAQKTVYFFIGHTTDKKITLSHEHIDYAWLSYEKAMELLTYDNAKEVLKKAHHYLTTQK
jgi:bis(5'-nucleosidyl)-tetraphosphatase